ncbi:MAG: acyl-CoA thioesterase domain-containing protein [Microthrixaceae bacterium]
MSTPPVPAAPTPRSILEDLVLTPVPGYSGRYGVVVDDGWRVLHVFGGMTKALALRAAAEALGRPDLRLVTTGATYVAPIAAGPVGIQADVIRSGRRGAQVRVCLWSGPATDEPRGDLLVDAVFGAHDDALPGLAPVVLPADARAPDASTGRDELARSRVVDVPFHRQTDWRLAVGTYDFTAPPDDPRTVSWFRFRNSAIGPGDAWDPAALAVPGDILGPAFSRHRASAALLRDHPAALDAVVRAGAFGVGLPGVVGQPRCGRLRDRRVEPVRRVGGVGGARDPMRHAAPARARRRRRAVGRGRPRLTVRR